MNHSFKLLTLLMLMLLSGVSFAAETIQISSVTTPTSVAPGNDGYVTLYITNVGTSYVNKMKIISVKFDSPILLKTTIYNENIGSLAATKATATAIRFSVPSGTESGFYSAKFIIEACDVLDLCSDFAHTAVITVQSPTNLEIVSVKPNDLMVGEATELEFVIKNNGNAAISNVLLSWEEANDNILPLGSDNRKFIESINGNSQIKVPVAIVVNPDATLGICSLDVDIEYDDPTGTKNTISSSVGLRIKGNFNFIVTAESQDVVAPGTSGNVNIKIANAGSQEAQFMTLRVLDSYPLTKIQPNVIYVGNLESDDYDTEKIGFAVGDTTPGEHALNIAIDYKDLYGNEYSNNYSLGITVYSSDFISSQNADYSWLFYIIIAIVAYLLYRKFRKKKK